MIEIIGGIVIALVFGLVGFALAQFIMLMDGAIGTFPAVMIVLIVIGGLSGVLAYAFRKLPGP